MMRSNVSTTGSVSSNASESENNTNSLLRKEEKNVAATKKMVRVGSDQTNKDEMPMDLLLTLATDEEEVMKKRSAAEQVRLKEQQ